MMTLPNNFMSVGELDSEGLPSGGAWASYVMPQGAFGKPAIFYKNQLLIGDLYKTADELLLNLYCPRCQNSINVSSKRKQIEFDPEATFIGPDGMSYKGLISVAKFRCTWEMGRSDATASDRMDFGTGLCRWTVGIDRNIAIDA